MPGDPEEPAPEDRGLFIMTFSDFQTAGGKGRLGPIVTIVIIGRGFVPSQESNAEGGRDLQHHTAQHFLNVSHSHTNHLVEFLPYRFTICTIVDSLFKILSAFVCKRKFKSI